MSKNNLIDQDRKSLPYLIGQRSETSINNNLHLPVIFRQRKFAYSHHLDSSNSIVTSSKDSKVLKNDRWKTKQLYIDDYRPKLNQRLSTQSKRSDQNVQKQMKKIFFTGLNNTDSQEGQETFRRNRSNQEIKEYIQKAQGLIKIIKKNKSKLIRLKINGPKISKESFFNQKQSERSKVFNYLQRNSTQKKQEDISDDVIARYITTLSAMKLHSIERKSREFLLNKVQNDYKNYAKVDEQKKRYIRSIILQQINSKKSEFQKEYKSRHYSPYFSFLSLSKDKKNQVIQRKQRRSLA